MALSDAAEKVKRREQPSRRGLCTVASSTVCESEDLISELI